MHESVETNLSLWKKALGVVPTWVWERIELETLVLADNGLSDLSDQIGGLKNLRMLDLGHNKLSRLPDALGDLDAPTDFLYLHDNELNTLPQSLQRLVKLRYLNLSGNAFETIPDAVTYMESLIELRVTDNRLTSIPDHVGRLSRLRELHLRNNKLTSLPKSIGALSELRQIDLLNNPLTHRRCLDWKNWICDGSTRSRPLHSSQILKLEAARSTAELHRPNCLRQKGRLVIPPVRALDPVNG
jgi:Leucine-rich repeat (LRR) protein